MTSVLDFDDCKNGDIEINHRSPSQFFHSSVIGSCEPWGPSHFDMHLATLPTNPVNSTQSFSGEVPESCSSSSGCSFEYSLPKLMEHSCGGGVNDRSLSPDDVLMRPHPTTPRDTTIHSAYPRKNFCSDHQSKCSPSYVFTPTFTSSPDSSETFGLPCQPPMNVIPQYPCNMRAPRVSDRCFHPQKSAIIQTPYKTNQTSLSLGRVPFSDGTASNLSSLQTHSSQLNSTLSVVLTPDKLGCQLASFNGLKNAQSGPTHGCEPRGVSPIMQPNPVECSSLFQTPHTSRVNHPNCYLHTNSGSCACQSDGKDYLSPNHQIHCTKKVMVADNGSRKQINQQSNCYNSLTNDTVHSSSDYLKVSMASEFPSIAKTHYASSSNTSPQLRQMRADLCDPSAQVLPSGKKRRASKTMVHYAKRRRSTDEPSSSNTIGNINGLKILAQSLALKNPVLNLQLPDVCLSENVLPPFPSDRNHPKHSSEFECNKYNRYPLMLQAQRLLRSDLPIINCLNSFPSSTSVSADLLHSNFLLNILNTAINFRPEPVCTFEPISVSHPSSPINLTPHFCLTPIDRSTPPLAKVRHWSSSIRTPEQGSSAPVGMSTCCLVSHSSIICSNCESQVFTTDQLFHWRDSEDTNYVFCSHYCMVSFQKKAMHDVSSVSPTPCDSPNFLEVGVLLSAEKDDNPVLLPRFIASKLPKSTGKRFSSSDAKSYRRRYPNLLEAKELPVTISKKWHGIRWRRYTAPPKRRITILNSAMVGVANQQLKSNPQGDKRMCHLCHSCGDAANEISGRLLNYDLNLWVHLNCILWCYDTYETMEGSLVDVDRSIKKAAETVCSQCNRLGAGLPCFHPDCPCYYHLPCAYRIGCSFYTDRGMYCPVHAQGVDFALLSTLAVERRVFVSRDECSQVALALLHDTAPRDCGAIRSVCPIQLRIGSLILHEIGQLLPDQLASGIFNTERFIYPIGYSVTRIYWSYNHIGRRCRYLCQILERPSSGMEQLPETNVEFIISTHESDAPCDSFRGTSCNEVWQQVLVRINRSRRNNGHRRIFPEYLSGEALFGLSEPHIVRIIESLPGVSKLTNYTFKFGRRQLIQEMPLAINPTGCARSEPKLRTHVRRPHIQTHRPPCCSDSFGLSSPGSPPIYPSSQSLISKAQLYRRLRWEWSSNVLLARSRIQGLGLYAARDLYKHTFIIEYLGEVIRQEIGNLRERLYESQNRGVYMFRVDDDYIVDATMSGGLARYINHSCSPNCTAEIMNNDIGPHIIIIASRDIDKGEELTYDYKFDVEDDHRDRIPCLCGSGNCRKWMN